MDNPTESRSHRSADNKKSKQNPHLSDEQLLLALDGESSAQEAAQVKGHLEACWSCRARREQIEKAIEDVVEYRDHLMKPYFPMPLGGRSMFVTRLEQLALSVGRPPLWKRILRGPLALVAIPQVLVPRYVWIVIMLGASIAFFSIHRLWQVPKVSASQLLENAQGSEIRALHSVARPVLYQKLRIRVGTQVVTRTIYRDPIGLRQADHVDAAEGASGQSGSNVSSQSRAQSQPNTVLTADAELRRTFQNARLNWQDPLSPASYSAWYKSLGEKFDEVTKVTDDLITLKTTTSEGPIAEARITVRASDFHPVEEDLRLQDARQVEVHELAWEVLPMEAINVSIFAPETMQSAGIGHPSSLAAQPAGLTDAELAEAELQARLAIHDEKADLGEQIELVRRASRLGQRLVVVQGIFSTQERKDDLVAALRGIPHVELRLQTLDEAKAQQNPVAADGIQDATLLIAQDAAQRESQVRGKNVQSNGSERPVVGRPAFERQLEERYPNSEDRIAFINRAVELAQDALAQAWALRRLRDRYTPGAVGELSRGSQQTLGLLIRDHVSLLRQHLNGTQDLLSPLLPAGPVDEVPQQPMPEVPGATAVPTNDWRSTVTQIFSETQRVCDSVVVLFAGSGETDSETASVVHELRVDLAQLQAQLPVLYESVSVPASAMPTSSSRDGR
jgi:hypothetical protein